MRLIVEILTRAFMYVWIGFNVRHGNRLPRNGPAIIVATHDSHLDTFGIKSLLPLGLARKVRPVGAADYFLANRFIAWFSIKIMRMIPVKRGSGKEGDDPLAECHPALARSEILLVYPEGSRGEPEKRQPLKKGIGWLAIHHPDVPVYVVYLAGLGKVMGKAAWIPIPFFCDVLVQKPLYGSMFQSREEFLAKLEATMKDAATELNVKPWG